MIESPEYNIEDSLVSHLQSLINGIEIEAYNGDLSDAIMRAKEHPNGFICVSHTTGDYKTASEGRYSNYLLPLRYIATILSNNRRERGGAYDYLYLVREALSTFRYMGFGVKFIRHEISNTRFPDIKEGVFVSEIEFEFMLHFTC